MSEEENVFSQVLVEESQVLHLSMHSSHLCTHMQNNV
jgi:hypothetical protein